jgi:hypothetical protein
MRAPQAPSWVMIHPLFARNLDQRARIAQGTTLRSLSAPPPETAAGSLRSTFIFHDVRRLP